MRLVFPEAFCEAKGGTVALDDPDLWTFVAKRYERLFERYPTAAGIMDRFGEQYETAGFTGIRVDKYQGVAWGEDTLAGKTTRGGTTSVRHHYRSVRQALPAP